MAFSLSDIPTLADTTNPILRNILNLPAPAPVPVLAPIPVPVELPPEIIVEPQPIIETQPILNPPVFLPGTNIVIPTIFDSTVIPKAVLDKVRFANEAKAISLGGLNRSIYGQAVTEMYVEMRVKGMTVLEATKEINRWIGGALIEKQERASSTRFIATRVIAAGLVGGAVIAAVGATATSVAGLVVDKEVQDKKIKQAEGLQEFFKQTEELSLLEESPEQPVKVSNEPVPKENNIIGLGLTVIAGFFAFG